MVDADAVETQEVIDIIKRVPDGRGREMADMEGLSNIDGRIIDGNGAALAHLGRAISLALLADGRKRALREKRPIYKEIQIPACNFNFGNPAGLLEFFQQIRGNFGRSHAQGFGQLKTGQSIIAHVRIRGDFQHIFQLGSGKRGQGAI